MTSSFVSSALPRSDAPPPSAAAWHGGVALAFAAAGALLLTLFGGAAQGAAAAFACLAVPAVIGRFVRAPPSGRPLMLVLWAVAAAAAIGLTGGLTGPMTVFCLMPVLAGAALGALWPIGAALSLAVLAPTAIAGARGMTADPVGAPLDVWLWSTALTLLAGAVVGALASRPAPEPARPEDFAPGRGLERAEQLRIELAHAQAALRASEAARTAAIAAREEAEASAQAKSRFLANMSHELRTPLNAVIGFSDIMRQRLFGPLVGRYGEYAELIHESGGHLLDLINDVLDMSKIEADRYTLQREVFDAREAVNAALRLLRVQADEARVQLRGVLPPEPLEIDADRRAIKQIVLNLVSNALKFTPAEGSVMVGAAAAGGAFELTVADTGIGIAEADLARLGRPYEQAGDAEGRAQGTGLGLSLVKAFAGLHGGTMTIESRLGEGAAVTVRLPVLVVAEPPAEATAVAAAAVPSGPPETPATPEPDIDDLAPAKKHSAEDAAAPDQGGAPAGDHQALAGSPSKGEPLQDPGATG